MSSVKYLLLVDDNSNDRELALRVLENEKSLYQVVAAHDGVAALDFLYCRGQFSERQPDNPALVLLDLKMPRLDGFEVLQQIKRDPELRAIPVVVFTSSSISLDVWRCYELGANAFVVKPVEYRDFVDKVQEIVTFWMVTNEPPPLAESAELKVI